MAILDVPGTKLTVNGTAVRSYDLDTTPVTPSDIGAYTTAQVDAAIAAAVSNIQTVPGDSLWSAGGAETLSRYDGSGSMGLTSGSAYFTYCTALKANTITSLGFVTSNVAGAGVTACRMALYTVAANGDVTMVARTASQTNVGTGQYASYTLALSTVGGYPASYSFVTGSRYAIGFFMTATTMPVISAAGATNQYVAPKLASRLNGQSDLGATYTNATIGTNYEIAYFYGQA